MRRKVVDEEDAGGGSLGWNCQILLLMLPSFHCLEGGAVTRFGLQATWKETWNRRVSAPLGGWAGGGGS